MLISAGSVSKEHHLAIHTYIHINLDIYNIIMHSITYGNNMHTYMEDTYIHMHMEDTYIYIYTHMHMEDAYVYAEKN